MGYSKRLLGLGSCALLLAGLVPGCGGDSGAAPISLAALPGQLADAWCDNIGGCCRAAAIPFDLASCKQALVAELEADVAQENNVNIKYDPDAAGRCVAAYTSAVKTCKDSGSLDNVCKDVFVGTLPAGKACTVTDECAQPANGSAYCDGGDSSGANATSQGVCTVETVGVLEHGKLGEACDGSCGVDDDCAGGAVSGGGTGTVPATPKTCFAADGLQCDFAQQTCQPLIALGGQCTFDGCVAGAICINGVCAKPQVDGASCESDSECASGACLYGTDTVSTGTCGVRLLASAKSCSGGLN